jgi:hypothetical protein
MGNDQDNFWFSGDSQAVDAVRAFATSFVGNELDLGTWSAAVGNDSCVADAGAVSAVEGGDYFDSAVGAVILATYLALVGPWPRATGCMQNQLEAVMNSTRWAWFGDEFNPVDGAGLCHFTLPPGSLPTG